VQGRRRGLKAAAVIVDDAWFIATITCLPGLSHDDRDGRRNVRVESGICTCRRRIGYRSTVSLVAELVAALAIGRGRQGIVEQNRGIAGCQTHASERGEVGRVSIPAGRRICDRGGGDRPEIR